MEEKKKPNQKKSATKKTSVKKPASTSAVKKSAPKKLPTKATPKTAPKSKTTSKVKIKAKAKVNTKLKPSAKRPAKKANMKTVQSETHAMIRDVILPQPMPVQSKNIKSMSPDSGTLLATHTKPTARRTYTLRQEVIGLISITLVGVALFVIMSSAYISTIAEIDGTQSTSSILKPYHMVQRGFHTPVGQVNFSYPDDYGVTGVGSDMMRLGGMNTMATEPISIQIHTHESPSLFEWMKGYTSQFKEFTVLDPNTTIKEWSGVWFDATIETVSETTTTTELVRGVLLPYNATTIIELRLTAEAETFSKQASRALELIMNDITVTPASE